jgi:hypothetical protein
MAGTNSRIKDISTTTTSPASDDYAPFDGSSNGTRRALWSALVTDAAAIFVAAPTTYKLCPLNGSNQIDVTYLSTSANIPKGAWDATANTPTLADGGGTVGDYYDVTVAGTQNLGSAPITYTVGDVVKYNGTIWYKIDSVANLFDGTSTQSGAATTGDYFQTADVNDLALARQLSNALAFRSGQNDNVSILDNDLFSLGDGTTPRPVSIVVRAKSSDLSVIGDILGRYGTSAGTREFLFRFESSKMRFHGEDGAGHAILRISDNVVTAQNGKWTTWGMSYTAVSADAAAADDITLLQNGKLLASSPTNNGSFGGFTNANQALTVSRPTGGSGTSFFGEIAEVLFFNRALTEAEHAYVHAHGVAPADQYGEAISYTADFSAGVDNWNNVVTALVTLTGNNDGVTDGVTPKDNCLLMEASTANSQHAALNVTDSMASRVGNWVRYKIVYYIPSGNTAVDGFKLLSVAGGDLYYTASVTGTWTTVIVEVKATTTTLAYISLTDGGATNFAGNGVGDDQVYIAEFTAQPIGAVLSLNPENIESDGDWIDASSNELNGTNTGATPLMVQPQTSGTFTPVITFSSVNTGVTQNVQLGRWRKISEKLVKVTIENSLSALGSGNGTVSIAGLPFTSVTTGANEMAVIVIGSALQSLTGATCGLVLDGSTSVGLYQMSATGVSQLTQAQMTSTSVIAIQFVYEIA